ncbi:formate transporter, partial [Pseudomonas sp. MPR-R2A6]
MASSKNTPKSDDDLGAADATDLHRTVREEGETAVKRPAAALLWSGLAAGIAINASLLFEGALYAHLPDAPWRPAVVSLGYPIGFLI